MKPLPPDNPFPIRKSKARFLGLSLDDVVRVFFGGNAVVSVLVLGLITGFLFREGSGFFGQNQQNLMIYRKAGLEYVDFLRGQVEDHTALTRYLSDLRLRQFKYYTNVEGLSLAKANRVLGKFDDYAYEYGRAVGPLRGMLLDMTDLASAIKTRFLVTQNKKMQRVHLLEEGKTEEAAAVVVADIDFAEELKPLRGMLPQYREANKAFVVELTALLSRAPEMPSPILQKRMERFKKLSHRYLAKLPQVEQNMAAWDFREPVPWWRSFTSFVFGRDWVTASFWQDWYGMLPLLVGSLMVSLVALVLAVPLGVGAAIYVNQIAAASEKRFIKPFIEFISAIPSVVLGFFGIAVLGQLLRTLSHQEWAAWVPGFPFNERLNILTAGCLLALIAVPTIFTLAEDAISNVPKQFKEASLALGATRLQTITRILVPASLSGIISAVLLGFGRVVGETMVVLLCAGNRIAIPDFSQGLGIFTQPTHTMTGIIAQEMGEVVPGSIHYRALFMVGIVLFLLALLINYAAQKIVRRYRLSIG